MLHKRQLTELERYAPNPVRIIPEMGFTLLATSQVAAAGGLVLGVYNLWNGLRKPVNEEQRELRGQLLDILHGMNDDIAAGQRRLSDNEVYFSPNPIPKLANYLSESNKLSGRLISPGSKAMHLLDLSVGAAVRDWGAIVHLYNTEIDTTGAQFHVKLAKLVETANGSFGRAQVRVQP